MKIRHHGQVLVDASDPIRSEVIHHAGGIIGIRFDSTAPLMVSLNGTPEEIIRLGAELITIGVREIREREAIQ